MFRNYLKIAWRTLRKQPTTSFINLFGLAVGLTCVAFIASWVLDELGYDAFHQHYGRIVRLVTAEKTETGVNESARTGAPMAKALLEDYSEIENAVRLDKRGEIVQYKNKQVLEPNIILTDPSFFAVFSYSLIQGNVATALQEPYSVVLTQSTAKKYFGDADPIGQSLLIYMYDSTGRGANYNVTGITPDPPTNAHFTFSMLGSFKTVEASRPAIRTIEGWTDRNYYTYLLLREGTDVNALSVKVARFYARHIGDLSKSWRSVYSFRLQPLSDIHLRSHLNQELMTNGDISQVYIFSTIGLLILLLVAVNYTNLTTARSVGRAKEVGVKKVLGAVRTQLIGQHLAESVLMAMLAFGLSLVLSALGQSIFRQITGKPIALFSSPVLLLFLLGIAFLLGIISGIYPAVVLSAYKPVSVLKGSFVAGTRGVVLRQLLVVSQFVITIVLMIGVVVIYAQMTYVKHKNLGYDKEAMLFIRLNGNADVVANYGAFRNDVLASPFVRAVTASNSLILNGLDAGKAKTVDRDGKPYEVTTAKLQVDADYLNVHHIRLVAGRNFTSADTAQAVQPVIVNERAVNKLGWKSAESAIGKPFAVDGRPGSIIGVIGDFHFNSLQHVIEPLAIYPYDNYFSRITIKMNPTNVSQGITFIEKIWRRHFPVALFDYAFVDARLNDQYRLEERFSNVILTFSLLSILIACLGLFGLAAFTAEQRTKEIGVRKVLGASVSSIVTLLSKDFLKLVLIAIVIASPIAWYAMNHWLRDFAYKIAIDWWMFAGAGLLAVAIALLTVSFQSVKAALMNPVKSLRSE